MGLNFRKIKQDLSPAVLKRGEKCYGEGDVFEAVLKEFNAATLKIDAKVKSQFEKEYDCQLEIDKKASEIAFSKCGCPQQYDCEHVVAAIAYIEKHLDELIAKFAGTHAETTAPIETNTKTVSPSQAGAKPVGVQNASARKKKTPSKLAVSTTEALGDVSEEMQQASERYQKQQCEQVRSELLNEYKHSWTALAGSPLFIRRPSLQAIKAQIYLILDGASLDEQGDIYEALLSIRLPQRVKPIQIPDLEHFFEALEYRETIDIAGDRVLITPESFSPLELSLLEEVSKDRSILISNQTKRLKLSHKALGSLLYKLYAQQTREAGIPKRSSVEDDDSLEKTIHLSPVYIDGLDQKMMASVRPMHLGVSFEYIDVDSPKMLLDFSLKTGSKSWKISTAHLLPNLVPGAIVERIYYAFSPLIKKAHLQDLTNLQDLVIPEHMFGTFMEHGLPRLRQIAVVNTNSIGRSLTTAPALETPKVCVVIQDVDGQLEARITFSYEGKDVPSTVDQTQYEDVSGFLNEGVSYGREIWFESEMLHHLFVGFNYNEEKKCFQARGEQQIIHFMTRILPQFKEAVEFKCPSSLLANYCYDPTQISAILTPTSNCFEYKMKLQVQGPLEGASVERLRECIDHQVSYIKVAAAPGAPVSSTTRRRKGSHQAEKLVVLELKKIAPVITLLADLGINTLENKTSQNPLWTLVHIDHENLSEIDIEIKIDDRLLSLEKQLKGQSEFIASSIPKTIQATLRPYQIEGVQWLERLRSMAISGVLADDMGLGKTLQAICALSQTVDAFPQMQHLIVAPTSLVDNWKEEIERFNPQLTCAVIAGAPNKRESLIQSKDKKNILVTSYSLMQKDVEHYKSLNLGYLILDEAQYIKNRQTRNARCVKEINSTFRLVLTGTPIENSLEELWSLFDFLMPGFLGGFERFCSRYLRSAKDSKNKSLKDLQRRIAPFILRRMKTDVLEDLPPINQIVYHCHLLPQQMDLYNKYAKAARNELSALVEKKGFEKVQIHVLATLTRLKQICCHPAIFNSQQPHSASSAKYDLFLDLVDNLVQNRKKAVVFSQYTRMLTFMKDDLRAKGIRFCYLDGTSKNRMRIVKEFNETAEIPLFLVSLKAGGAGLNLVGADTVIHYDMWWNPAVENQATDRVHRIGQTEKVSSYKLVTLGTIEEKIIQLQEGKKGLVKQVIGSDDDVISKLTWNEVLEILST